MLISIIIPVYNAEKYLRRCMDSVLKSLDGLVGEILLVDNKSKDHSDSIMRYYHHRYQKIVRVLQCNVPGAAAARNLGVKEARGDYIWFVDADDYISNIALIKLIGRIKKTQPDMLMIGAERMLPDGRVSYLSAVDANSPDYKSRFVRYGMGPWQVIIRRKWWLEHDFRFKEGFIHEDMELMSALILYTDNFDSIDEPMYFYCNNPDSVLHKETFNPHIFDIFVALNGLRKRFARARATKKYHDELEWFFVWNLLIDSAKDFAKFPEGKPGFEKSRKMLQKYYPNWRKNKFLRQKPLKLRIRVRLNYNKR